MLPLYLYKIVRPSIDILLNIVFEKTDSDERNHTKQFRQSVAVNQNVKIGPGYFAIGFPRGQLLILIPVRGRLYRRPKSPIKDYLLIKRRRKVADLAKLPLGCIIVNNMVSGKIIRSYRYDDLKSRADVHGYATCVRKRRKRAKENEI